ncbi:tuftelin-interacting protein 11 [Daktulosphaira vitifoliae]|uniref:tuftelin-interacting protein 11 n=1 Tax=Daktulosphaira vitifoliae TaxID=58002 RepID=UPI0021AA8CE2|nr:tuftelin-interacting protein 11 [Daktulosphaira vitifoliae]
MSDEEMEKFEITDFDLDNEFNMNRPQRRLTKNQAIYGVWADEEQGDSDVEPSGFSGRGRKDKKYKQNYTAPVSFVAGGIQQAGKDKEKKESKEDNIHEESESLNVNISSSDDEKPSFSFDIDQELAGLRKKRSQVNPSLINKGLGDWEKHTKGIGAKLLLGMGYQPGHGLGKKLQGITAPIEANLRKGRGAIGAYGPETKSRPMKLDADRSSDTSKDGDKPKATVSKWRKKSKAEKTQYIYKTVEDVIEESKHPGQRKREFNELSRVKVIDMTGPEQRILSGYHAISGVKKPTDQWEIRKDKKFSNFDMPELLHNLNLLVEMAEQNIISNNQELCNSEDRLIVIERETNKLEESIEDKNKAIHCLEKMLVVMEELNNALQNNTLNSNEAIKKLTFLKENYYPDYRLNGGSILASSIAQILIKEKLSTWDPLQDPSMPFEELNKWKALLILDDPCAIETQSSDEFQNLIWQAWFPQVQKSCGQWKCHDSNSMLKLIEQSAEVIPNWIVIQVLETMILPKIQSEVEQWDPLTDLVPIHVWVHPWLPYLSKHFETIVYPTIRQKLSVALNAWHPSDNSAKLMLQPWVNVFQQGHMEAFLINNIVPKLQAALQAFVINPHHQQLDNWNWVSTWIDLLPVNTLVSLLEQHFFPKWLKTLTMWINMNPNHEQISNWYTGWKSLMPPSIIEHPSIKGQFHAALDIMSRAVGGPSMPAPPPPPTIHGGLAEAVRTATQMPHGFKELVQKRCEERGILWMPIPGRYREAKQIYRCGARLQAYIDRGVLFVSQDGSKFVPTSVQSMLELCE